MISCEGFPVFIDPDIIERRNNDLKSCSTCLGPEDLVCVTAIDKSSYFSTKTIKTCHYINGFVMNTPASFCAYLAKLISDNRNPNLTIVSANIYAYNSFKNYDFSVYVTANGEFKAFKLANGKKYKKIVDNDWTQICLSEILRHFRGTCKLHYSLYGTRHNEPPCLRVFLSPNKITLKIVRFLIKSHPITDEFQQALAFAAVYSFNIEDMTCFLAESSKQLPTLIGHLTNIVPPTGVCSNMLYPLFDRYFNYFCDDVVAAVNIVEYFLKMRTFERCKKYIPLLSASLTVNPLASICFSRICLFLKKYREAFYYLNFASYAHNWPSVPLPNDLKLNVISQPETKLGPNKYEKELHLSPFHGVNAYYFFATYQLMNIMSKPKFHAIIKEFESKKHVVTTEDRLHFTIYPSIDGVDYIDPDTAFLFDEGIEADIGDISNLPKFLLSASFATVIKEVEKALEFRQDILESIILPTRVIVPLSQAIHLNDRQLLHRCLDAMKRDVPLTGLEKILCLFASVKGIDPNMKQMFDLDVSPATYSQQNAFILLNEIYNALFKLSKKKTTKSVTRGS